MGGRGWVAVAGWVTEYGMLVRRWDGEGGAAGVYVAVAMAKVGRFGAIAWQGLRVAGLRGGGEGVRG